VSTAANSSATGRGEDAAHERVYDAVYDALMDHRLPPGTRLPEAALSAHLGVSRPAVRRALVRLAHERVVELRPNRSPVVASPSVEETRQVFDARRVVEAALVRGAAAGATRRGLERARATARAERAAAGRGERGHWVRLSGDFHRSLAAMGGNEVLAAFLGDLISRTTLIIALYDAPGRVPCESEDHERILAAVTDGDAARAESEMLAHLGRCQQQLALDAGGPAVDLAAVFSAGGAAAPAR